MDNWFALGGTAFDGITYGPPSSAIPWGTVGCPLIPRIYRIRFGQQVAPLSLKRALKVPNLTLAELDSEALRRFNLVKLPSQLLQAMRGLIYDFPIMPAEVAIPAGIPLSWLTALPISSRLRRRLRHFGWPYDWIIEEPLWFSEIMSIPGLGKTSLNELLCVLETAELGQDENKVSPTVAERTSRILGRVKLGQAENNVSPVKHVLDQDETKHGERQVEDKVSLIRHHSGENTTNSAFQAAVNKATREAIRAGFLQFETHSGFPAINEEESEVVCSVSVLGDLIREFVTWALAETDTQTIGEAISQVVSGTRTVDAWQAIAELRLKHTGYQPSHPYAILESWAIRLPERERHIFNTRIACFEVSHTLQDLGAYFGVTRERVRQLEKSVQSKLSELIGRKEGEPIRWRAKTVRQMIGVASPPRDKIDSETGEIHRTYSTQVEQLLSPLDGQMDYREIVLRLAGPYELNNGWLVLKSAVPSDPTKKIREMADEIGYIDRQLATIELNKWGLDSSLHEEWLVRDGKIRKFNGRLVRWDGSIGDKLVIALADIGRPTTIEALLEYVHEDRAKFSAFNALALEPRAVRISRKEWALVSWGLSEYSGIAMSIRQVLVHEGKPIPIENIVTRLQKDSGLKEGSVRAYCQAPMFVSEDGTIRLRRNDEPYEYQENSLHHARGVFVLGPHRASLLIEVERELLRGSGRALTHAAGAILGVALDQSLDFYSQEGASVTITFPETSLPGPTNRFLAIIG